MQVVYEWRRERNSTSHLAWYLPTHGGQTPTLSSKSLALEKLRKLREKMAGRFPPQWPFRNFLMVLTIEMRGNSKGVTQKSPPPFHLLMLHSLNLVKQCWKPHFPCWPQDWMNYSCNQFKIIWSTIQSYVELFQFKPIGFNETPHRIGPRVLCLLPN